MKNQHEFAIFYPNLTALLAGTSVAEALKIQDADLTHRIERVLRLKESEFFVLFDRHNHARCMLKQFENRKTVHILLVEVAPNRVLAPKLTIWLPLLKRDDLEEAIYSLVELGANSIRLVMTQKVQRTWGEEKELDRLQRIIIAAAEQAKNFAFPELHGPVTFELFQKTRDAKSSLISFDCGGTPLLDTLQCLQIQKPTHIEILIGPEGDLTESEKQSLQNMQVITCALTPTILRARQAVAVGVGALRAVLK